MAPSPAFLNLPLSKVTTPSLVSPPVTKYQMRARHFLPRCTIPHIQRLTYHLSQAPIYIRILTSTRHHITNPLQSVRILDCRRPIPPPPGAWDALCHRFVGRNYLPSIFYHCTSIHRSCFPLDPFVLGAILFIVSQ